MKKLITLLALSLLFPVTAFAAPVSWDFSSGILQPLQSAWSAVVKASRFQATSTVASIFPYASTTAISASNLTSGNCVQASTGGFLTTTGSPCGLGTVTSIATNNGITGGTITTTGTIGLATINAGVLGAVTNGVVPTSQATSSLYGTGTGGQVLGWSNATGGLAFVATSSAISGVTAVTATYPLASSGGNTPIISTNFGTTTTWGMGNNGLVMTGATGIPFVTATSSAVALSITGNAATVTTNANLTGVVTSTGNATVYPSANANTVLANATGASAAPTFVATSSLFSWNGTGLVVRDTSPTLTTASLGSSVATTQSANDNSTKLATTAYVDNAVLGQNFKEAVKYASTGALPSIVYANGSSGVGATLTGVALAAISLDSSSPSVGDRVLIKNQSSTFQNGIYTVTATGSGIAVFVLTRTSDADQASDYRTGDALFVTSGSTLSATTWAYTGADSPTMGTDALTYVQVAGQGSFTGGTGITITGTSIAYAAIAANSLWANGTSASAVPTVIATSTLFGTGSASQVLSWNGGVPAWVATTTFAATSPITVAQNANQITYACSTCLTALPALSGAVTSNGSTAVTAFGTLAQGILGNPASAATIPTAQATSTLYGPTVTFGTNYLSGFASSTPWGQLSINPIASNNSAPSFVVGSTTATNFIVNNAGFVGIGTTSPWGLFSINPLASNNSAPAFTIGSTSATTFVILNNGSVGIATTTFPATLSIGSGTASSSVTVAEYAYGKTGNNATSTAATLSPRTSNTILWPLGFSATTLTLCNFQPGDRLVVRVTNPNGTAGALTWATCAGTQLYWPAKTTPTQTTTANDYDEWAFKASASIGSTTSAIMISGSQGAGY